MQVVGYSTFVAHRIVSLAKEAGVSTKTNKKTVNVTANGGEEAGDERTTVVPGRELATARALAL